ncbi:MAG TPA: NAD(+)/NADH kinase [Candidatus Acidoferrum sp.]|nr:NAD(+)/NADH kinase [Candidatus Acidoferrum sp.]
MQRIGIAAKPNKPEAAPILCELVPWLRERKCEIRLDHEAAAICPSAGPGLSRAEVVADADLAIVLGGDGTLLSIARLVGPREVPILGVNLGGLGFLTEITLQELFPTLETVLRGEFAVSRRLTMTARILRAREVVGSYEALNDVVVTKTAPSRIVDLEAYVNGEYLATFRADGLIVATPTGSTAYCLSAGGPIMYPSLPALVVIPICPHTLTNRPLVLPDSAEIEIMPAAVGEDVHLTVDGQVGVGLKHRDVVSLRRSDRTITLIKSPKLNYFELLRTKLKWGER